MGTVALALSVILTAGALAAPGHPARPGAAAAPRLPANLSDAVQPIQRSRPVERTALPAPAAPPGSALPTGPASAPPAANLAGSVQQALINADRGGLGPLRWSSCLASVAGQSARRMAAQGFISHAGAVYQDLGCGLGSRQSGENVGYWSAGVDDGRLNTMFMNSPEHRANIMGPYHWVGTAWAVASNGCAYIAVEFG